MESCVGLAGPLAIAVSGGVRSIVHAAVAGLGSIVPAVFRTRTENAWPPSASPVYCFGELQLANAPPSSWHSNVAPAPAFGDENASCAEVEIPSALGTPVIAVSGMDVSIVHAWRAGVGS